MNTTDTAALEIDAKDAVERVSRLAQARIDELLADADLGCSRHVASSLAEAHRLSGKLHQLIGELLATVNAKGAS